MWVGGCWGVGHAGESVGRSASGRWLGWGVLVEHGVDPSIGFCLEIAWVERRRDVDLDIGWSQRRGYIGSGLWCSDTAWVSWSEYRQTASVEIKLLAYEEQQHG